MISRFAVFAIVVVLFSTGVFGYTSKAECTSKYLWWNSVLNQCEMAETKACIGAHGENSYYDINRGSCVPMPHYAEIKACQSQGEQYKYNQYGGVCEGPPSPVQVQKSSGPDSDFCLGCRTVLKGGVRSPDPAFIQQCRAAGCYGDVQLTCPEGYRLAENKQGCVAVNVEDDLGEILFSLSKSSLIYDPSDAVFIAVRVLNSSGGPRAGIFVNQYFTVDALHPAMVSDSRLVIIEQSEPTDKSGKATLILRFNKPYRGTDPLVNADLRVSVREFRGARALVHVLLPPPRIETCVV